MAYENEIYDHLEVFIKRIAGNFDLINEDKIVQLIEIEKKNWIVNSSGWNLLQSAIDFLKDKS